VVVKQQDAAVPAVHHQSPTGLCIFWLEVLELAHAGEDDAVAQRLSQLAMRREDLDEVFGSGSSAKLWSEYTRAFASFAGAGAREIAQKIRERRYDDVEVVPQMTAAGAAGAHENAGASMGASQGGTSGGMASAERAASPEHLRTNHAVYSVRLKRTDEADGIRIDTFVYLDGAWRTALKVGRK
jgi:hypothetical protein